MLISDLPFEIILHLANFLPTKDRLTCTSVCRSWKVPLQESLWRTVDICNKTKLDAICDITSDQHDIFKINGHRVHTLRLADWLSVNDRQFYTIQNRFQYLNRLYVRIKVLGDIGFDDTTDWKLSRHLSQLEIYIEGLTPVAKVNTLFKILSFSPSIIRLEYIKYYYPRGITYTLEDFEKLHTLLPQLQYLSLDAEFDIPFEDLTKISTIMPVNDLTVVKLRMTNLSLQSLYYFLHKYHKLRTLELDILSNSNRSHFDRNEILPMFSSLNSVFPYLEKIIIKGPTTSGFAFITLWKLIRQFDTPLKHLVYDISSRVFTSDRPAGAIIECIRYCSTTLETISIFGDVRFSYPHMLPLALGLCHRLVALNFGVNSNSIALDDLLDHCTSLKRLRLSARRLYTKSKSPNGAPIHKLQILETTHAMIEVSLFSYLSCRCKYLKYLRMADAKVFGQVSRRTGSLCIDMFNSRFELLQLNSVCFYGTNNFTCDEEALINLIALTGSDSQQAHSTNRRDTLMPINGSLWYHTHFHWGDKSESEEVQMLENKEAERIHRHFRNFRYKNEKISYQMELQRYSHGIASQQSWKNDFSRGYVAFCCGYVVKAWLSCIQYTQYWHLLCMFHGMQQAQQATQ
ncbi:hypothetical protein PHYBLDRAFT_168242 [Phycomyces blakesleeanus NRRL 1555(-)]|uniref:F-box domain-containing protein n=1 Tax=Phycomyces blakesleeanus (strain ATCC 8743b / DSM 1359 / FGSC 10004 / NBRC 33097 / NRRL 1555) TaxID=763407 RepID=A0A162U6F9_PHYB8|nr:hypothetical protein PHYBLDRAFT_168242 [Phycomyces blakesleeanus NRRL 1555(-)]OAD73812.1 hypothetical protein PHYBLDRAFT_168242 [Phycomyces blakesleeanus NRRL 1555(-)]|eukprot:XP_018291852.1 hypothetical protein PHYBLDRAFT_168242 [Phycomyces blakesleeanus NRRL 1555(-)]